MGLRSSARDPQKFMVRLKVRPVDSGFHLPIPTRWRSRPDLVVGWGYSKYEEANEVRDLGGLQGSVHPGDFQRGSCL